MSDRDRFVEKLDQLMKEYETAKGRLDSWWREGKSNSRTNLAASINNEMGQVLSASAKELEARRLQEEKKLLPSRMQDARALEQTQIVSQINLILERTLSEIQLIKEDTANKIIVYREASRRSLDPTTYLSHQTMRLQADIELERTMQFMNLEMQREVTIMQLRLQEYREKALMDFEMALRLRLTETQALLQLQAGDVEGKVKLEITGFEVENMRAELAKEMARVKMMPDSLQLDELHNQLSNLYMEIEKVKALPDSERKTAELIRLETRETYFKNEIARFQVAVPKAKHGYRFDDDEDV